MSNWDTGGMDAFSGGGLFLTISMVSRCGQWRCSFAGSSITTHLGVIPGAVGHCSPDVPAYGLMVVLQMRILPVSVSVATPQIDASFDVDSSSLPTGTWPWVGRRLDVGLQHYV